MIDVVFIPLRSDDVQDHRAAPRQRHANQKDRTHLDKHIVLRDERRDKKPGYGHYYEHFLGFEWSLEMPPKIPQVTRQYP